jgi:hypothetical protein
MTDVYEFSEFEKSSLVYDFVTLTREEIEDKKKNFEEMQAKKEAEKAAAAKKAAEEKAAKKDEPEKKPDNEKDEK